MNPELPRNAPEEVKAVMSENDGLNQEKWSDDRLAKKVRTTASHDGVKFKLQDSIQERIIRSVGTRDMAAEIDVQIMELE